MSRPVAADAKLTRARRVKSDDIHAEELLMGHHVQFITSYGPSNKRATGDASGAVIVRPTGGYKERGRD